MSHPLRIAVLGFWHVHAGDYAQLVQNHAGTELVAVWDDDEPRGRAAAAEFGVAFTPDLDALLARDDLDAVTVTTATDQHTEVIGKALAAGKHVFTEKVLAPTVHEAEALVARAAASEVALTVSLPRLYHGYTTLIRELLRDGSFGTLTYTRVRLAHDGWVAGWLYERFADPVAAIGGALTDLGCHPVYLTRLFHGTTPERISATYTSITGRTLEDNAVVTAEFAGGAIGVIEAGFATSPSAFTIEVRGTSGALVYGFDDARMLACGPAFGDDWVELDVPENEPGAFERWIQCIHDGTADVENLHAAVELTRMVEAANRAAHDHASVAL